MFRTSLKRSAKQFYDLHSKLDDSVETASGAHSLESASSTFPESFGTREYHLLDAMLETHTDQAAKFKTRHVPSCLINSPVPLNEERTPNCNSLLAEQLQLPAEVDRLVKGSASRDKVQMGSYKSMAWIAHERELIVWSPDVSNKVLVRHTFEKAIQALGWGTMAGVGMQTTKTSPLVLLAVAFEQKIGLYNYSQMGMLEQMNITFCTNNERVNWISIQQEGLYYGGDEGCLKVERNANKKWKLDDPEKWFLKNPKFLALFVEKAIQQVIFTPKGSLVYCLVVNWYKDNWLSRRLFWRNGCDYDKEIAVYLSGEKLEKFWSIKEHVLIATIQKYYPQLAELPYERLRIQSLSPLENSNIGVCLSGGVFLEICNPVGLELNRPVIYQRHQVPVALYTPLEGNVCEYVGSMQRANSSTPKANQLVTSLGLNNISVFANPTEAVFISDNNKEMSSWTPNQSKKQQRRAGSALVDKLSDLEREVTAEGQLVEVQQTVSGLTFDSQFRNTVFTPMRQWLYLESGHIHLLKRMRLLDLTLVLVKSHYDIVSQDNLKALHIDSLEESLKKFISHYGLVSICECLLEIILNNLIKFSIPQKVYRNTVVNSMGVPLQPEKASGQRDFRVIENTQDVKIFTEKLLIRLSRNVKKPQFAPSNTFYSDLMEKARDEAASATADALWHVLLKYYHSLFEVIRNQPMNYFGKERRFCCYIRQKMEILRRFLVNKYKELQSINFEEGTVKPKAAAKMGFDSLLELKQKDEQKLVIDNPDMPRFGEESTKSLIFYMASSLKKIQLLMEIFEKFNLEGCAITIKLCLTNPKVAEELRGILLNYYSLQDPYMEVLQQTIPEIVSYPDIIFHSWEHKSEADQLRVDLRESITILNLAQLNKVVKRLENEQGGLEKIIDLLIYRFDKLEGDIVRSSQTVSRIGQAPRDSISASVGKLQAENKELRRDETFDCLREFLSTVFKRIKENKKESDLRSLEAILGKLVRYVDSARRLEDTRIHLEDEKTIIPGYRKIDTIVRQQLDEKDMYIPRLEKLYTKKSDEQPRSAFLEQFTKKKTIGPRIDL